MECVKIVLAIMDMPKEGKVILRSLRILSSTSQCFFLGLGIVDSFRYVYASVMLSLVTFCDQISWLSGMVLGDTEAGDARQRWPL
mgnify:FL=1